MDNPERPFVIIDGKKYVLAEEESFDPLLDGPEPEIFQKLGEPPRNITFSVRMLLLLNSGLATMFGWIFACFGMIFCILFLPMSLSGLPDLMNTNQTPTGEGVVKTVEKTNTTVNDVSVYRYTVEAKDGTTGTCYTNGEKYKLDQEVELVRCGEKLKISGTRLSSMGAFSLLTLFVLIFPGVGLGFILYGTFKGRKAIRLLQDGELGKGKYIDMNPTGATVNNRAVMKLHYKFVANDGETYDAYATALDTEKLTDDAFEPLFYDRMNPSYSVLFDSLPGKIRFDEMERMFRVNPLQILLPILFCGLFFAESVLLIYAMSIGGLFPI